MRSFVHLSVCFFFFVLSNSISVHDSFMRKLLTWKWLFCCVCCCYECPQNQCLFFLLNIKQKQLAAKKKKQFTSETQMNDVLHELQVDWFIFVKREILSVVTLWRQNCRISFNRTEICVYMSDGMFQQNSLTEHAIESFNIFFMVCSIYSSWPSM